MFKFEHPKELEIDKEQVPKHTLTGEKLL